MPVYTEDTIIYIIAKLNRLKYKHNLSLQLDNFPSAGIDFLEAIRKTRKNFLKTLKMAIKVFRHIVPGIQIIY